MRTPTYRQHQGLRARLPHTRRANPRAHLHSATADNTPSLLCNQPEGDVLRSALRASNPPILPLRGAIGCSHPPVGTTSSADINGVRTRPSTGLWVVRAAQSGTIWQEMAGFGVAWGSANRGRRSSMRMSRNVQKCRYDRVSCVSGGRCESGYKALAGIQIGTKMISRCDKASDRAPVLSLRHRFGEGIAIGQFVSVAEVGVSAGTGGI
jgi:hypothetical protein